MTDQTGSNTRVPTPVRIAVGAIYLFGLACLLIAADRRDDLGELAFFLSGAWLAAGFARNLRRGDHNAWLACWWIGVCSATSMGFFTVLIAGSVALNASGMRDAFLADPWPKAVFFACWFAMLVVAPGTIAACLTRRSVREWVAQRVRAEGPLSA